MKYIKYFIIVLLIVPVMVFGITIDVNEKGSLNVKYQYGEKKITDSKIFIYKVASYNSEAHLSYTSDFNLTNNLDIHTASEVSALAEILNNYINENNIDYLKEAITDSDGECSFDELDVGLYLIVANSKTEDEYQYFANPSLIGIPTEEESTGSLKYDSEVILKTESKNVGCPNCEAKKFKITTKVVNGNITPDTIIEAGESIKITYSPNSGYYLASITIDGKMVDITKYPNGYDFENVDSDHVIEVIYEKEKENTPSFIPKTIDEILTYVFLLTIAVIIVILLAIYAIKINKNKKGSNKKNEKNK